MKTTKKQKGIAPVIIALIVAVVLGGGYVVVKTNPGLAKKLGIEKQAEKEKLIADKQDETTKGLSFAFANGSKKCDGYAQKTNADGNPAQFQTSAPRDNKSSIGSGYDIGIRNKFGTSKDIYDYTVSIQQPDATIATANGRVTSDKSDSINFPNNFSGSKAMEGVYSIVFKVENKIVACDEFKIVASDWKTYTNNQFGFEIKYPANYFIHDYGYIASQKDTTFTAAVLAITDSEKTYQSGSGAKIVVYVSRTLKNLTNYLEYIHTTYASLKKITVTKENKVDLGGIEGIEFFGSQKDSTGKVENIQSILGSSKDNKTQYEIVAYSSDYPLFSTILSTFKFTK